VLSSPTVGGSILFGAATLHGVDTMQSGVRQFMSGEYTQSFTSEGIELLTGSETIGEYSDALLGAGLTLGAGSYLSLSSREASLLSRTFGYHRQLDNLYSWGAPAGGHWSQGIGYQTRSRMGLVGTEKQLHHWLIPQNQWGRAVPNYIKNQRWNLLVTENRAAHAMIDTAFSVRGVTPYALPMRPLIGMPNWARATVVGSGLGLGYLGSEISASPFGTDNNLYGDPSFQADPTGKKQEQ